MYKLIALDMDGTLLNDSKKISKANASAIAKAKKAGKHVILATGRPLAGIESYLQELNMSTETDYVVTFNGALVKSLKSGAIIAQTPVTHGDYKRLFILSQNLGVHIHALTESTVLTPKFNPYTQVECDINDMPYIEGPVSDVDENTTIIKVMFVDDPQKLDAILNLIPEDVKRDYTIVRSAPIFLEFLHPSVNKGTGVDAVAEALGISKDQVICVGDAGNDIDMIQYAGLGVAMGNAFPEVKAVSNYITKTNEEDGVAHVIEKFMLQVQ